MQVGWHGLAALSAWLWVQLGLAVWCWFPSLGFGVGCAGWLLGPGSFASRFGFSSDLRQIGFGKAWSGVTDLQQVAVAVTPWFNNLLHLMS